MRNFWLILLLVFQLTSGCQSGLKQDNQRLKKENEELKWIISELNQLDNKAIKSSTDLWKLKKHRDQNLAKIVKMVKLTAKIDVSNENFSINTDYCKNHQLFKNFAAVIIKWAYLVKRSKDFTQSFKRQADYIDLVFGKRIYNLKLLGLHGLVSKPFLKELISYHHKIVSTKNWEQKFKQIRETAQKHSILDSYPNLRSLKIDLFYQQGFPKHSDQCLTQGSFDYYFEGKTKNISLINGHPPEFWFYTFWFRRYFEGTFDFVQGVIKKVSGNY